MADVQLDSEVLSQLSHDQKNILEAIDKLRNLGVGKLINLPQIVVIGDQSSGKSSVLEAISRVRFPSKGGVCTRFATELVMRRKNVDEIVVRIRSEDEDDKRQFEEKRFDKNDLPGLIEQAREAMGVDAGSTGYSEEVLRVEISGPKLLPLTLVDLPGFYHAGTSEQPPEGIPVVARLAEKYMKQKNSIILAVLSAKAEMSQQTVLEVIKKHDPTRERTMGIITKPDTLVNDSSEADRYAQLASNKESAHILKHGWHVLRNRNSEENDEKNAGAFRISDDERDRKEAQFFQSGTWASHPSNDKGIGSLRRKLSKVLTNHIYTNLPTLVQTIETGLETRRDSLRGLGKPRSSSVEMQEYLHEIFNQFRDIAFSAVKGTYEGKFFADIDSSTVVQGAVRSDPRKLRAVIRNLNRAFVAVITVHGSKFHINDYGGAQVGAKKPNIPGFLQEWVDQFHVSEPLPIPWAQMKSRLELLASNNQGTRFPGSPNDKLALELFREQSERWGAIATTYIELVTNAVEDFIDLVLRSVVPSQGNTRDAIYEARIEPFFDEKSTELRSKLGELLRHYQEGDAICLEDLFLSELYHQTQSRATDQSQDVAALVPVTTAPEVKPPISDSSLVPSMTHKIAGDRHIGLGLESIIDMMNTYYSISLRTFMDNVVILAVENCLITKVPVILDSKSIYSMNEETLDRLAGETADIKQQRATLSKEISTLDEGLKLCKRHLPRKVLSMPEEKSSTAAEELMNNDIHPKDWLTRAAIREKAISSGVSATKPVSATNIALSTTNFSTASKTPGVAENKPNSSTSGSPSGPGPSKIPSDGFGVLNKPSQASDLSVSAAPSLVPPASAKVSSSSTSSNDPSKGLNTNLAPSGASASSAASSNSSGTSAGPSSTSDSSAKSSTNFVFTSNPPNGSGLFTNSANISGFFTYPSGSGGFGSFSSGSGSLNNPPSSAFLPPVNILGYPVGMPPTSQTSSTFGGSGNTEARSTFNNSKPSSPANNVSNANSSVKGSTASDGFGTRPLGGPASFANTK